jgi:hypothetical protein
VSDTDVRDLAGQVRRVLMASTLGIVIVLAMALEQRDHFGYWWRGISTIGRRMDLAIMIALAFGVSLACYTTLEAMARARWRCSLEALPDVRALTSTRRERPKV